MSRLDLLRRFSHDYDTDNDNLFLYDPKSKSSSSVEINGLVIDYNSKNEISGVEISNASKFLSNSSDVRVTKDMLSKIIDSKIQIKNTGGLLFLRFLIVLPQNKEITTTLTMPYLEESNPAISV